MVKKRKVKKNNLVGSWSFIVGIFLAMVLGLGFTGTYQAEILWATFLLGIVVGLLNISVEEMYGFLTSSTVLVLVSYLGINPFIWNISIFLYHGIFANRKNKKTSTKS